MFKLVMKLTNWRSGGAGAYQQKKGMDPDPIESCLMKATIGPRNVSGIGI